jgi:hypothetical protein
VGVFGQGRFTQSGGKFSTSRLTVGSGGTVNWSGGSLEISTLAISGRMSLGFGSGRRLAVNCLEIAPLGKLDLSDNSAIIDYSGESPLPTIHQYLIDSRLFTSAGIPGVTGLGYLDDGSVVRVQYTYMGDANLDGVADLEDFDLFLGGFTPTEATPQWVQGDFDYSGIVDLSDFELYLHGYYALGGSTAAITDAVKNASLPPETENAMLGLVNTVPEPAGGVMVGLLSAAFMLRRRASSK